MLYSVQDTKRREKLSGKLFFSEGIIVGYVPPHSGGSGNFPMIRYNAYGQLREDSCSSSVSYKFMDIYPPGTNVRIFYLDKVTFGMATHEIRILCNEYNADRTIKVIANIVYGIGI